MAPGRIFLDANGQLVVPDEPTIPVAVGDGAGEGSWRLARRLAEEAVARAFGGQRKAHFLEVPAGARAERALNDRVPTSTVNAFRLYRVGLDGGQEPLASEQTTLQRELRSLLDLHVALVGLPGGPLVVFDQGEAGSAAVELPAGSANALRFLGLVEASAPALTGALRFGTVAAADRYHAERRELEPGVVEATVGLVPTSRLGVERLTVGAARLARAQGRTRLTLVEPDTSPRLTFARRIAARLSLQMLPPDERPALDQTRLVTVPARLESGKIECLVASEREGLELLGALAPRFGGRRALARGQYNLETGHAVFGPYSPDFDHVGPPLVEAIRLLFTHLGWTAAAQQLGGATGAAGAAA